MKPEALEPLTISPDTDILMNQLQELQKDIRALAPLLDRLTHHCEIVETGNESWRFKNRA